MIKKLEAFTYQLNEKELKALFGVYPQTTPHLRNYRRPPDLWNYSQRMSCDQQKNWTVHTTISRHPPQSEINRNIFNLTELGYPKN
ncbi:hypothetical protein TNCV_4732031 [Trichonephila clavipes]|nr:hypothetical protein TNCV_4732031 [Trichonephila clavipes]